MWPPEQVRAYSRDPVLWMRDVLRVEPYPWQANIFQEFVKDSKPIAVKSCNGAGKTAWLAWLILWFISTRPFPKIQATAPSEDQLFNALWAECAKWISSSPQLSQMLRWSQTKISMKGHEDRWWAVARTARVTTDGRVSEGLQGLHEEHTLSVVDEASGVPEQAISALYGMLATGKGRIVLAGNPLRLTGTFYDSFTKLKDTFKTFTVSYKEAPGVTQEFVDFIERMYGLDSVMYTARVLGEFPTIDAYVMFTPEDLDAIDFDLKVHSEGPIVIGGDISDGGDCESVFTIRQGNVLLEQRAFRSIDAEANADAVEQLIGEFKPDRVMIDGLNIGSGVISILKRRGHQHVYPVKGSNKPKDKSFFNCRSELYFLAAKLVRERTIKSRFRCDALKRNLLRHFQEPREDGLFAVITKAKLRKDKRVEEGGSPDYSDSFVYSLYGDAEITKVKNVTAYSTARILEANAKFRKRPGQGFAIVGSKSRFAGIRGF